MSKKYKNNFLTNVIFRIDFSPILNLLEDPIDFQSKIRRKFPVFEKKDTITKKITLNKDNSTTISENKVIPVWSFSNDNVEVMISSHFLSIITKKYETFEKLFDSVKIIYEYFIDIYNPVDIRRSGLRYINEVKIEEGNPFEWSGYINENLLSALNNFLDNKKELSKYMNQMIINKDDYNVTFTYGINNSLFPEKISKKEFILDYDCFSTYIDAGEVLNFIKKANEEINNLFERSIEDNLRKLMGSF